MTLETDADRLAILKLDGETFSKADLSTFTARYSAPYAEPLDVESSKPSITVRTSDVSDLAHGDTITRSADSTVFKVRNPQPDGQGMTVIYLEAQA